MNAITQVVAKKRSLFDDWTYARPYLLPALKRLNGLYEEEDIIAAVLAGAMRLWIGDRCAAVTEIQRFPRMNILNAVLAGAENGHLENLLSLSAEYEEFGRANGCKRVHVVGRKGWERALPDCDFLHVTLSKDL